MALPYLLKSLPGSRPVLLSPVLTLYKISSALRINSLISSSFLTSPALAIPMEHVKQIIHRLQQEGYDAYAVGGCVRDTLLGRSPQDWDITTSAKPQVVKSHGREIFNLPLESLRGIDFLIDSFCNLFKNFPVIGI